VDGVLKSEIDSGCSDTFEILKIHFIKFKPYPNSIRSAKRKEGFAQKIKKNGSSKLY